MYDSMGDVGREHTRVPHLSNTIFGASVWDALSEVLHYLSLDDLLSLVLASVLFTDAQQGAF